MKVVMAPPVMESFGFEIGDDVESFTPWSDLEDQLFGKKGTYRRYRADRDQVKGHIKETFVDFLVWPLRFLPWGHVSEQFWSGILQEGIHGCMDRLSFVYFGDKFVVGLRAALRGERHNWHKYVTVPTTKGPYVKSKHFYHYPLWLITKLVWPRFREVRQTYLENK